MKVYVRRALMKQQQPPVTTYQLTRENMHWINENVTKAGLLPDGEGIWLKSKFGKVRCHMGMIIIENSAGNFHTMSKSKFNGLYDVLGTEELDV